MDQIDEIYRDRLAAIWRVLYATKYVRNDNVPCQIEEGLYLGSLGAANNKTALKSLNVTHILTVAGSLAPSHPNDFVYKVIEISVKVDADISRYFEECFNFIEEGKKAGGVLVHCFVGKSRSVTIVVAYLMKKHGMRLSEALEHVRSKRLLLQTLVLSRSSNPLRYMPFFYHSLDHYRQIWRGRCMTSILHLRMHALLDYSF